MSFLDRRAIHAVDLVRNDIIANISATPHFLEQLECHGCITTVDANEIRLRSETTDILEKVINVILRRMTQDVFVHFLMAIENEEFRNRLSNEYRRLGGSLPQRVDVEHPDFRSPREEHFPRRSVDEGIDLMDNIRKRPSVIFSSSPTKNAVTSYLPCIDNCCDVFFAPASNELLFTVKNNCILITDDNFCMKFGVKLPFICQHPKCIGQINENFILLIDKSLRVVQKTGKIIQYINVRGKAVSVFLGRSPEAEKIIRIPSISSVMMGAKVTATNRDFIFVGANGLVHAFTVNGNGALQCVSQFGGLGWKSVFMSPLEHTNGLIAWSDSSNRIRIATHEGYGVSSWGCFARFPNLRDTALHCSVISASRLEFAVVTKERKLHMIQSGKVVRSMPLKNIHAVDDMVYNKSQNYLYLLGSNVVMSFDCSDSLASWTNDSYPLTKSPGNNLICRRLLAVGEKTILVESFKNKDVKVHCFVIKK